MGRHVYPRTVFFSKQATERIDLVQVDTITISLKINLFLPSYFVMDCTGGSCSSTTIRPRQPPLLSYYMYAISQAQGMRDIAAI